MNNGILLALLAYAVYSWSDAAVKALGGGLTIFEIGFYAALISSICIVATTPRDENWLHFWRMKRPWAVQTRALSGAVASVFSIIAFTSIPLAEVYALVFLAPLFVTILSLFVLKEHVGPWRWFAVVAGFRGRPACRAARFPRGRSSATSPPLFVALLAAISVILMRSLSGQETRTTMLGFLMLYVLLFNGVAMMATTATLPTPGQAAILLFTGIFSAAGNILLLQGDALRAGQPAGADALFADRLGGRHRRAGLRRTARRPVHRRPRHHRRLRPAHGRAGADPARHGALEPVQPQPA